MLSTIGVVLIVILIILVLLAVGGAGLLLLAYGLGLLVTRFTHFEPFQATVLALVAILAAGVLLERIVKMITSSNSSMFGNQPDDEDEFDDEEDDQYLEDDEDEEFIINPGIPRWRQPLKQIDFSNIEPDVRCPCGSGRKYKNCHGAKQARSSRD